MKYFVPISKIEERDDGTLFVSGVASAETLDSQGEKVTAEAMKGALPDFFKLGTGNLREMHQMSAAGRVDKAYVDDGGKTYIECTVVDPVAIKKVQTDTYKGFSIGGRALSKSDGVISSLRLSEISLVDRPANPDAVIQMWKAEQFEEQSETAATVGRFDAILKSADVVPYSEGKPVFDASQATRIMQDVFYLLMSEASEEKIEPEQLAMLRNILDGLKAFVIAELSEKEAGTAVQMGDGIGNMDLLKGGAKYSAATKAALAKVHGMLKECDKAMTDMGYADEDGSDEGEEKADLIGDLAKASDTLAKVTAERDDLVKRVKELEAQPAAAKAATTDLPVSKTDDTSGSLASQSAETNQNDPLAVFKAALSKPIAAF